MATLDAAARTSPQPRRRAPQLAGAPDQDWRRPVGAGRRSAAARRAAPSHWRSRRDSRVNRAQLATIFGLVLSDRRSHGIRDNTHWEAARVRVVEGGGELATAIVRRFDVSVG